MDANSPKAFNLRRVLIAVGLGVWVIFGVAIFLRDSKETSQQASLLAATQTAASVAPAASTAADEATQTQCTAVGNLAAAIVQQKASGAKRREVEALVRNAASSLGPGALETSLQITELVYGPLSGLSVEGAKKSFYFDCLTRASLVATGQKSYDSPAAIGERLAGFRTFNGKPLVELLRGYGVRIERVDETPAEAMPGEGNLPGDVVVVLTFAGQPVKKMPCSLNRWFKDPPAPIAESIRRADRFPVSDPEQDDPVLYWAHTGKCSKAYSF